MNQHQDQSDQNKPDSHSTDYAPYPKLDPNDVAPPPAENWTSVTVGSHPPPPQQPVDIPRSSALPEGPAPIAGNSATTMPAESNPYVSPAPVPTSSTKNTVDSVKDVLGKWGKKAAEATKKAEDLAGNVWQHLKTGPSFADAAVGRIAQGTKVLAEGGYEKIFRQTFETVPEEQLLKSYACYLSTSAGPVMGILYLSTAKLAFCSDNPLSYKVGDQTQWSYYKGTTLFHMGLGPMHGTVCSTTADAVVNIIFAEMICIDLVVIPLHQLKAVNTSTSKVNTAEKYVQIISVDNHEFWFMGFVNYDSAVKNLQGALQSHNL